MKRFLKALSARFSNPIVKVDESTANAARMCKLYGTLARKGESTLERPHRRSFLLETPERIEPVTLDALHALASEAALAPLPGRGAKQEGTAHSGFDIEQWLGQSGLEIIKGPEAYGGGRKWMLRTCPFNAEHVKPVVIELANGALVYRCLHRSCTANGWKAFRGSIGPTSSLALAATNRTPGAQASGGITDLSQLPSVWSVPATLEWCIDGMIARGSITLICSESGIGKTWLGYYLAGCVAHGVPALGRQVQRLKVVYVDGENPVYTIQQRLKALNVKETSDLIVWGGWNASAPEGPQSLPIVAFTKQHKPLIIFDLLIEFHSGSEQSSTETRTFMRHFRTLANLGATVVVLHHSGKAETAKIYRGSSDIKAAVDTAYHLENVSGESNRLGKLSLRCFKGRLAPGMNFGLEFSEGEGFVACDVPKSPKTVEKVVEEILKTYPGSNQTKIIGLGRRQQFSKRKIEDCLKNGPWRIEDGPNNSILYYLPKSDQENEN